MLPKNDAPIAFDAFVSTIEQVSIKGKLIGFDPDGDRITFMIGCRPSKGNVEILPFQSGDEIEFEYHPGANAYGNDTFFFVVDDGRAQDIGQVYTQRKYILLIKHKPYIISLQQVLLLPCIVHSEINYNILICTSGYDVGYYKNSKS